ncbi:hypothetical protein C450_02565 [Halococcus salifodinae DSM 8989]|uniref:Uncharacterized protein n=1 Tax=Halococcus salifodinae DSM 8989 TaxID=1227456 RepID=M0NBK9_9EURY|nr:hypothetical protein C450_02565 [Halococcus salifodinae DSM 8989]
MFDGLSINEHPNSEITCVDRITTFMHESEFWIAILIAVSPISGDHSTRPIVCLPADPDDEHRDDTGERDDDGEHENDANHRGDCTA